MKIKILKEVPVKKKYRPEVGKIYEVHRTERALAFITVNGTKIGSIPVLETGYRLRRNIFQSRRLSK